jgi:oligosaccharide reducing-end xylanase
MSKKFPQAILFASSAVILVLAGCLGGCNSSPSTTVGSDSGTGSGGKVGRGGNSGSVGDSGIGDASNVGGRSSSGGVVGLGGNGSGGVVVGSGGSARGGATGKGGSPSSGGKSGSGTDGGTSAGTGGRTGSGGSSGGSVDGGGSSTTTIHGDGCTPPAAYANLFVSLSGHTQAETDAKLSKAWSSLFNPSGSGTIFYNGPGSDESYVQDVYSGDVRTEGMSYGMMIAVQLDHQTEFDRLWTWVRNHMASGCSASGCTGTQIAWSCTTSGSKKSSGGAPDGDEYFAAALVFAHKRWGDTSGKYNYETEAQWVLKLVRTQDFNSTHNLVKYYSGSDNGQTDASYVLPAFYQTWACFDTANASFWETAVTAGRKYFKAGADANGQFGDQSAYDGSKQVSTGVDKIRVVVNIMMDWNFFAADPWQKDTYAPAYAAREKNASGAEGSCASLLGFGLPASSGKAFVDKLWSASIPSHDYWNGVLYMLALLHVSGTFHLWY